MSLLKKILLLIIGIMFIGLQTHAAKNRFNQNHPEPSEDYQEFDNGSMEFGVFYPNTTNIQSQNNPVYHNNGYYDKNDKYGNYYDKKGCFWPSGNIPCQQPQVEYQNDHQRTTDNFENGSFNSQGTPEYYLENQNQHQQPQPPQNSIHLEEEFHYPEQQPYREEYSYEKPRNEMSEEGQLYLSIVQEIIDAINQNDSNTAKKLIIENWRKICFFCKENQQPGDTNEIINAYRGAIELAIQKENKQIFWFLFENGPEDKLFCLKSSLLVALKKGINIRFKNNYDYYLVFEIRKHIKKKNLLRNIMFKNNVLIGIEDLIKKDCPLETYKAMLYALDCTRIITYFTKKELGRILWECIQEYNYLHDCNVTNKQSLIDFHKRINLFARFLKGKWPKDFEWITFDSNDNII